MDSTFLRNLLLALESQLGDGAKAWVYAKPDALVLVMEAQGRSMYVPLDDLAEHDTPEAVASGLRLEFDEDAG